MGSCKISPLHGTRLLPSSTDQLDEDRFGTKIYGKSGSAIDAEDTFTYFTKLDFWVKSFTFVKQK